MIDIAKEKAMTLAELARDLGVHKDTVWSWTREGRWNHNRTKRVVLESLKLTGGLGTSMEAYRRMIEAMQT